MDGHPAQREPHHRFRLTLGKILPIQPIERPVSIGDHRAAHKRLRSGLRWHQSVGARSEPARSETVNGERNVALSGQGPRPILRHMPGEAPAGVQQHDTGEGAITWGFGQHARHDDISAGRMGIRGRERHGLGPRLQGADQARNEYEGSNQHLRRGQLRIRPTGCGLRGSTGASLPLYWTLPRYWPGRDSASPAPESRRQRRAAAFPTADYSAHRAFARTMTIRPYRGAAAWYPSVPEPEPTSLTASSTAAAAWSRVALAASARPASS